MTKKEIINNAINKLRPLAEKEIEEELYYIENDSTIDIEGYEPSDDFCQECGEKVIAELRSKYKDVEFWLGGACSQESENFAFCEECGKRLHVSLLLCDQELEHWEGLELNNISQSEAFELTAVFECYDYCPEFQDRLEALAKRVIEKKKALKGFKSL